MKDERGARGSRRDGKWLIDRLRAFGTTKRKRFGRTTSRRHFAKKWGGAAVTYAVAPQTIRMQLNGSFARFAFAAVALLAALAFSATVCTVNAAEPQIVLKKTPRGTHYGVIATENDNDRNSKEKSSRTGPTPTLFIIGNPISMVIEQEKMRYFLETGSILARHGWTAVVLDPANEGFDVKEGHPPSLGGWAIYAKQGKDFVGPYVRKCMDVLDHLIAEEVTDPQRVVVEGISRGGFCALHFAARDARIQAVVGISPVTNPLALTEFAGLTPAQVSPFGLDDGVLEKLAGRTVWVSIGNMDDRVSTDDCIQFTRRLVATTRRLQPKLNLIPVTLRVGVSTGHRSPDEAYGAAADFLLARFPEAGKL